MKQIIMDRIVNMPYLRPVFFTLFFFVIAASIIVYTVERRKDASALTRAGQIKYMQITIRGILLENDRPNYDSIVSSYSIQNTFFISPVVFNHKTNRHTSWREFILDCAVPNRSEEDKNFSAKLFRSYDQKDFGQTNFLLIVGDDTIWDEKIQGRISFLPDNMDKILIVEIPTNDIAWNSLQDITPNEVIKLWTSKPYNRGFGLKPGLLYVTLQGEYGYISDFTSPDDLKKMLVFSSDEIKEISR